MDNKYNWSEFAGEVVNNDILGRIDCCIGTGRKISEMNIKKDYVVLACCMVHILNKLEETENLKEKIYGSRTLLGNDNGKPIVYNVTHGRKVAPFGILKYQINDDDTGIDYEKFSFLKNVKQVTPLMRKKMDERIDTPIKRIDGNIAYAFAYDDALVSQLNKTIQE
jgi:hypothetical protein